LSPPNPATPAKNAQRQDVAQLVIENDT